MEISKKTLVIVGAVVLFALAFYWPPVRERLLPVKDFMEILFLFAALLGGIICYRQRLGEKNVRPS